MDNKKVWFITGASKGIGLCLAKQLLKQRNRVATTSRNIESLITAIGTKSDQFLPLQVNLSNEESVASALEQTQKAFGKIDVVVNNAGYGIGGSIEELSDRETRDNFDINVFGTINVIRQVLPYLRSQQSGHIINISSIAGIAANTGWSIYAATKYAIIGLSEVLAEDVRSMGIRVTVVAPGAFRTSFLSPESLVMTQNPLSVYEEVRASHAKYLKMDGKQAGDPEKAAEAMIRIAEESNPPLYLLLGSDAYQRAFNKLTSMTKEFQSWEALTKSTDFNN